METHIHDKSIKTKGKRHHFSKGSYCLRGGAAAMG